MVILNEISYKIKQKWTKVIKNIVDQLRFSEITFDLVCFDIILTGVV